MEKPLWAPSQEMISRTFMFDFIQKINQQFELNINDYPTLHAWSISHPDLFWQAVWDYDDIKASKQAKNILVQGEDMQRARWFVEAELNFAENLLRRDDDHIAIDFRNEQGLQFQLSYHDLRQEVARLAHYLRSLGLKKGERVVGMVANMPEAIIAMLATTSIGAVWSACSPDFGLPGLIDRFAQIEPTILFAVNGHYYNGKTYHHLEKIKSLQTELPTLKKTIILNYIQKMDDISHFTDTIFYEDLPKINNQKIEFTQVPFNHPVYILYSSGTTGKPKCIVHGVGGTLIQHLKEQKLHCDIHADDKLFFYTTCTWMMWNWLVSGLALGATLVLYDGAPFYPKTDKLIDLIDEADVTHFGVGAKLIEVMQKNNLKPKQSHQLISLRYILVTASPLLPESFDYLYQNFKQDLHVCSISGGTDIISCFAIGNPILPIYRGEIQCIGLGMDVKIFNEQGESVIDEAGELVCASPFPSMPIYFWNDPDGEKYHQSYFTQFPNVWTHGDYAKITQHGGLVMYGRSDATLNPGGIRIGTAEIYNQVEKIKTVVDSLAIGQQWENSERIILFVKLHEGAALTPELIKHIEQTIRVNTSPHHVPKKIIQVPDLPRTFSGKVVELAVKKVVHGQPVNNLAALENPEALEYFKDLAELER